MRMKKMNPEKSGFRAKTSVTIDSGLWKQFKEVSAKKDLTMPDAVELLIIKEIEGVKQE